MDKKSTFLIAGIIIIAVVVFVFISFQKSTFDTQLPSPEEVASTTAWENAPATPDITITPKTVVSAKHAYRNGEHIIAGEVPLPTPCHILDSNAVVSTDKKNILLQLTSSVVSGEVCAAVVTPARFKVTAKADKNATITATLNRQDVTLNLIDAGPNDDLDNFELYIKG